MTCSANGTTEIASKVDYSLGSPWVPVPTESASYAFVDDSTTNTIATKVLTPPAAPIGSTNMLIGLQNGGNDFSVQAVPLADAPEGGTCHP
jgi:ABC-type glycerol-3-phosphate transport system permease component